MLKFCGEDKCTVDFNGRIKLPQHFIDDFLSECDGELVMHCLAEGALALYPEAVFQDMRRSEIENTEKLASSMLARRNARRFGALSRSEVITRQGRITIPELYRERCELKGGVFLIGVEIGVEIWAEEKWNRELAAINEYANAKSELEIKNSLRGDEK